jgi:hypothetical protein
MPSAEDYIAVRQMFIAKELAKTIFQIKLKAKFLKN